MLKSTCVARITLFSSTWLRSKAWFCLALMSFALVYAQTSPPLPLAGALYISLSCCLLFYLIALLNMPPKCLSNTGLTLALSLLPCYDVSRVLSLPSYARVQKLTFFALTLGYMMATAFTCIEAAFMRTLVRELLRRIKPRSLVFIHDGLLISPEPSTVDLEACLIEASLGLHLAPPPHFQVKIEKLRHDKHPSPGPLPGRAEVHALVTTDSRPNKARKLAPVAPTGETLHNFWSRRSGSTVRV